MGEKALSGRATFIHLSCWWKTNTDSEPVLTTASLRIKSVGNDSLFYGSFHCKDIHVMVSAYSDFAVHFMWWLVIGQDLAPADYMYIYLDPYFMYMYVCNPELTIPTSRLIIPLQLVCSHLTWAFCTQIPIRPDLSYPFVCHFPSTPNSCSEEASKRSLVFLCLVWSGLFLPFWFFSFYSHFSVLSSLSAPHDLIFPAGPLSPLTEVIPELLCLLTLLTLKRVKSKGCFYG